MAFTERVRQYWLKVQGNRCQWEYEKDGGIIQCNSTNGLQVHHVTPEGQTKARGGNPDETVGLVLCSRHHVRNIKGEIMEEEGSMHPDVGMCYEHYGDWKTKKQHLEAISGRRISRYDLPSPFEEMAKDHHEKAKRGERYHSGDERTDGYYERKATDLATRHNTLKGGRRPETKRRTPYKPAPTNWEWSRDLYDEPRIQKKQK